MKGYKFFFEKSTIDCPVRNLCTRSKSAKERVIQIKFKFSNFVWWYNNIIMYDYGGYLCVDRLII